MGLLSAIAPSVSVAALLVLALLPWGVSAAAWPFVAYLPPLLPLAVILYWLIRRPEALPLVMIFATGLTVDAVTRGPLGFWALIYLMGSAIILLTAGKLNRSPLGRFTAFAGGFVMTGALAWLVATAYTLGRVEVEPVLAATGLIVAFYPVLALLLWPLSGGRRREPNFSFDRGR